MRFIYSKTFIKIFAIFVVLGSFVILDAKGYLGLLKDGFFRVFGHGVTPVTAATNNVKGVFSVLFTIKNLASENAKLSQKIDQLAFENARLKSAQDENQALRKALNLKQVSEFNLLSAEVLNSDPTGFTQVVVIDKGSNQAVALDQSVVVAPGILVGKVTKLYPNSSQVTLITDPSIVINAEVVDSGARGLVRGEHGLGLSLDLVTQNELIKTEDEVSTSGLSDDFPKGLLIGEVSGIRSSATDLFQKAFISPAADLRNLKFLFVVQ